MEFWWFLYVLRNLNTSWENCTLKLGHSSLLFMTHFLSKSTWVFDHNKLNFIVFSKFQSYFKEHFDLGFLYTSFQRALEWMWNSEITVSSYQWTSSASVALALILPIHFFQPRIKFVFFFFFKGSHIFPLHTPWLPPQCWVQGLKQLWFRSHLHMFFPTI